MLSRKMYLLALLVLALLFSSGAVETQRALRKEKSTKAATKKTSKPMRGAEDGSCYVGCASCTGTGKGDCTTCETGKIH